MKILYFTSYYWPFAGGIEVLAQETLGSLKQRGYEFTVITDFGSQSMPAFTQQNGIPIHRFHLLSALASRDLPQLLSQQREIAAIKEAFRPDVVHLNYAANSAFFALRTQNVHPAPLLLAMHSDVTHWRSSADTLLGQCLQSADWICSVSHSTHNDVLRLAPDKTSSSSVILNALQMPDLAPAPLPFEPPHMLCLGRLVRDKGFDIALEAFALLSEKFPAVRMTVAGEGPVRAELEEQAAALGLRDRVTFAGRLEREEIAPMINTATMVVVPSRYREPFALVALEAAQMARPVIAPRWGGLVETIADGESGVLVKDGNAAAFTQAMTYLLENPAIARAMGQRGRERAQDLFSLERCVDEYDALYRQLAPHAGQH